MLERERKIEGTIDKTPESFNRDLLTLFDAIPHLDFFIPDDLDPSFVDTQHRTPDEDVELILRKRDNLLHGVTMTDEEILYEYRLTKRINNSEYRDKLMGKLDNLLENAACTDFFQHTLRVQYGNFCYLMNKPQHESLEEKKIMLTSFGIGTDALDKGIFDKESAREIERLNYFRRIQNLMADREHFGSHQFLQTFIPSLEREGKELAEWRDKFIQHYNDEP